jgi:hypothetical protein
MTCKSLFASIVVVCSVVFTSSSVRAQVPGDPQDPNNIHGRSDNGNGNNGRNNGVSAPLDGGLSLLLAGGICYGIKKAYNKRKQPVPANTAE